MSLLLRMYPREWRDRYGDEIEELLASSDHPARDRLDLARGAISMRLDHLLRRAAKSAGRLIALAILGLVMAVVGAIATVNAVGHLQGGVIELPGHWWSTLAAAPLCGGVLLSLVVLIAWRRRSPPNLR
jgi:hypothetical protein